MAAYDAREEAEAHAKAEERASEAKAKAEERAVEAKEKAEAATVEAEDAFARAFRAIDYCEKKHAGLKGPELEENLNEDDAATLDNLHEAVATLEDTERIAHPITKGIENELRAARAALRARENAATVDPD